MSYQLKYTYRKDVWIIDGFIQYCTAKLKQEELEKLLRVKVELIRGP